MMSKTKMLEYINLAKEQETKRKNLLKSLKEKTRFDTLASHGIYNLEEATKYNHGAINPPVYFSSSQVFKDADELEAAFQYLIPRWTYSRIANPTLCYLEDTLALLEAYGSNLDTSCCVTSSGMSAITAVIESLLTRDDDRIQEDINFVSSIHIYGGTVQQFSERQKEKGVLVRWVKNPANLQEWDAQIDENTRFLYAEVPSNPNLVLCDIAALANLAHSYNISLIIDSTIATPALLRPLTLGADIVVHSLSKSITSSGHGVGGAIIAIKHLTSKWLDEKIKKDFVQYLKFWPNRDNGICMHPMQAYLILSDLRTLRLRMDILSNNTQIIAEFLNDHQKILTVNYPGLDFHPNHELASRLMKLVDSDQDKHYGRIINRYGHLLSFRVVGGHDTARKVFNNLQLIWRTPDLGKIQSTAVIPSISTHQQQGENLLEFAGIQDDLIRLSVGIEHVNDIIADLEHALK